MLFSQNYFEINRLLILELLYSLKKIVNCDFTKPLHDLRMEYLEPLKATLFPKDKLSLTHFGQKELEFLTNKCLPAVIHHNDGINNNLVEVLKGHTYIEEGDDIDIYQLILILTSCTARLLEGWRFKYTPQAYQEKLSKHSCDVFDFSNKKYFRDSDTLVSFDLNDLLKDLGLKPDFDNRIKVKRLLNLVFKKEVSFKIDGVSYHQHLIHSLEYTENVGQKTKVALMLHPFVHYEFYTATLWYRKGLLPEYYDMLAENSGPNSRKPPEYKHSLLFCIIDSGNGGKFDGFKNLILTRDKKTLKSRKLIMKNILGAFELISKYYARHVLIPNQILQSLESEQKSLTPFFTDGNQDITLVKPSEKFWEDIFLKNSDQLLEQTLFHFFDRDEEQKD